MLILFRLEVFYLPFLLHICLDVEISKQDYQRDVITNKGPEQPARIGAVWYVKRIRDINKHRWKLNLLKEKKNRYDAGRAVDRYRGARGKIISGTSMTSLFSNNKQQTRLKTDG